MKFLNELISAAGFAARSIEIKLGLLGISVGCGLISFQLTQVFGLSLAVTALSLLFFLEGLRLMGNNRQRNLNHPIAFG